MAPSSAGPSKGFSTISARDRLSVACLLLALSAAVSSRFAHLNLVWIEEAYGLAAASELLRGRRLYSELWFDKPPLYAWFYTLCGASPGVPLRILDSLWIALCAAAMYFAASSIWGRREGLIAASLAFVYLTFWIPSAVMAVAPDLLLVVPHAVAIALAVQGRSAAAGIAAGIGLLCNSKAVFVLAAVLLWAPGRFVALSGFLAVQCAALLVLPIRECWEQVWVWGYQYSSASFIQNPWTEGLRRTGGWVWFHLSVVAGAAVYLWRQRDWRIAAWIAFALAGTAAGTRFFPRYYFLLLPPVLLAASRGLLLMRVRSRVLVLALVLIPVARFGPRYGSVAWLGSHGWSDTALMDDSRQVSRFLPAGCQLLVWGYRPDVFVFSGCHASTPFLDSQPLTGVIADRHLSDSTVTYASLAKENRELLTKTEPEFIVDGLGVANPALAITTYPDLTHWLGRYELIGRTGVSLVYQRRGVPDRLPLLQER